MRDETKSNFLYDNACGSSDFLHDNKLKLMGENLEHDINAIKNNLSTFGMKLEMVYAALVGNEIAKDGGLVADIVSQQKQILRLKERIEKVEARESKRQLYLNIIWGAVGVIITLIITHFFNLIK